MDHVDTEVIEALAGGEPRPGRSMGAAVADACGLGEDDRHRSGLALHEAAANAVLHGNGADPAKRGRSAAHSATPRATIRRVPMCSWLCEPGE
ncbi:hypothetical protein ACW23B_25565 [Streptomyces albidoflavus]